MRLLDYFKLGGKNFRRNGYKTVLPILIITIGIVLFNVMSGFFTSIINSTKQTVTDNNSLRFIQVNSPTDELKQSDFKEMEKIEGVLSTFPDVENTISIKSHDQEFTTQLIGIPSSAVSYFTSNKVNTLKPNEMIVSSTLSKAFKEGEAVPIVYTVKVREGEGIGKEKQIKIGSFYDPFYIPSYPSEIYNISFASIDFVDQLNAEFEGVSLSEFRKKHGYSTGTVIAKEVADVSKIGEQLDRMGYVTEYALKASEDIPIVVKIIGVIGGMVLFVLLLSSGISIASIMGSSLRGRYKEIGILRALGFERSHLVKLFSIEVIYIVIIAFMVSVLSSASIMSGIQYVINHKLMSGSSYHFVLAMDVKKVLISLLMIVVVSFLASIRPILKASSISVTDIIRGNE